MANEVVMPRLGWTMETGRVVEWLKADGERIEAGDPLFSVETDKAVTEVESLDSGVLRIPPGAPEIGAEVAVGAMLAWIVAPGEVLAGEAMPTKDCADGVLGTASGNGAGVTTGGPDDARGGGGVEIVDGRGSRPRISPRARRAAAATGFDWATLVGSGSSGRIRERDVRAAIAHISPIVIPPSPRASPGARRMAEARGVALGDVPANGPGGRVTRADVRAVSVAARSTDGEEARLSPIRRITAARMAESARTAAPVTLTTEADATDLMAIRGRIRAEVLAAGDADAGPVPSVTDLLVKLAALALSRHPDLNASFADDRIVRHAGIHIGVAVDTERGLLAPVIRDAAVKSLHAIAAESARLIAAARSGAAAPDDLGGGTFTISNLGMYEIDAFTPIINLPECAVLGVGRVVARPVVVDDESETIAVRKMLSLSLTFDHRVVDGAPAARFLQAVKGMVERPYAWVTR